MLINPKIQIIGINKTIKWYLDNIKWMKNVTSGDYQMYCKNIYK